MPVCSRVFFGWKKHSHISIICSLILIGLFFFSCVHTSTVFAGIEDTGVDTDETLTTNPKDREVVVTATVTDTTAPSVPILVAPADDSTIITTLPTFIWEPSTDDQGISKYQLWLDGSLLFDSIPTGNTTNSSYTLIVEDGEMKLTVKSGLSQGSHTWYIKVFDVNGNTAVSATWDFTIDTVAPTTTITQIGDVTTTITSADSGSVPSTPYELSVNEPVISGASENGATLQLTVIVPGEGTLSYSATVSGGSYSFTLPTLPVDTVITFTLISTDSLGNSSTISNVKFLVKSAVIIFPPPTPEPTVAPGETPGIIQTPGPSPIIEIEVPRPTEIIKEVTTRPSIIDEVLDQFPLLQELVDSPIGQAVAEIAPVLTLFVAPTLTTIAVAQSTTSFLLPLWELLSRILQALGLIPKRKPRGIVYDTKSGKPVAFVTISINRQGEVETTDSVVSDQTGVYRSIKLPVGRYALNAVHTEYIFPTKERRPFGASIFDYYKGETFEVKSDRDDQFFIIPVDPKNPDKETYRHRLLIATFISSLRRFIDNIFYPMAVFSFMLTVLYPTLWNIAVSIFYVIAIYLRLRRQRLEPAVVLHLKDRTGAGVSNVIVRTIETQTNTLRGILFTDEDGYMSINLPPGKYTFTLTKDSYALDTTTGDLSNLYVDHGNKKDEIQVAMARIDQLFPDTMTTPTS